MQVHQQSIDHERVAVESIIPNKWRQVDLRNSNTRFFIPRHHSDTLGPQVAAELDQVVSIVANCERTCTADLVWQSLGQDARLRDMDDVVVRIQDEMVRERLRAGDELEQVLREEMREAHRLPRRRVAGAHPDQLGVGVDVRFRDDPLPQRGFAVDFGVIRRRFDAERDTARAFHCRTEGWAPHDRTGFDRHAVLCLQSLPPGHDLVPPTQGGHGMSGTEQQPGIFHGLPDGQAG